VPVRTDPRHELRRHSRPDRPDARSCRRRPIVDYLHWRFIFFVNLPIGIAGLVLVHLHLPDYREQNTHPLDIVGLILFGSASPCCPMFWRSSANTAWGLAKSSACWRCP
jgi:hypothetical protein